MSKGLGITAEDERIAGRRREDAERQTVAEQRHSRGASLRSLLEGVELRSEVATTESEIRQVTHDSRRVQSGALFVAISGVATDGTLFARDAVSRGAIAVVSEAAAPVEWPAKVPWVQVAEARKALAITATNFYGRPTTALKLTGVTGTNGKTTTTSLIDSILRTSGAKTGLFGTISYHTPTGEYPAPNTTPESVDL
jgi:UDP-N-acetylmuramoyl-L-alanyl-D-glutamate--2,6-diaminopimelate ligase